MLAKTAIINGDLNAFTVNENRIKSRSILPIRIEKTCLGEEGGPANLLAVAGGKSVVSLNFFHIKRFCEWNEVGLFSSNEVWLLVFPFAPWGGCKGVIRKSLLSHLF